MALGPGSAKSYATWWSVIPQGLSWSSLCASVGCRDLTTAEKEPSTKNSRRLRDIRMPQAVLHNQLTATNVTEKYPTALRICISYCMLKWRKSISENKLTAKKQPNQGGTERYPSICTGCKRILLHQSWSAQEEVNTGNETQAFIWHVLTECIDSLHKILREEITCVSSTTNTCPITTQTFDNGLVNTGAMNTSAT